MIALIVAFVILMFIIGATAIAMALRDGDSWLHRRLNPSKKYADEGLSTEMADLENVRPGEDGFPDISE